MNVGILHSGHAHLDDQAHSHPNFQKTATFYGKACELGEPAGCFGLALLRTDGKGVVQDAVIAQGLFERACALGHPIACKRAGAGDD